MIPHEDCRAYYFRFCGIIYPTGQSRMLLAFFVRKTMADFTLNEKTLETSIDRAADSLLVYDNSAQALRRTNINSALDLTSHPVGINDVQTLTQKTIASPNISSPVLSGTVSGTYTLGGTPTFPSSVVTLTGSQTLTNKTLTSPTINTATISNPTLTVDSISEHTSAAGVTIDGVLLKDSNVTATNVAAGGTLSVAGASTLTGAVSTVGQLSVQTSTAPPAAGATTSGIKVSSTANLGIFWGSGAPTFTAAQGSVYIRTDGSSTSTRLYSNTTGSTTWTNFTSAA